MITQGNILQLISKLLLINIQNLEATSSCFVVSTMPRSLAIPLIFIYKLNLHFQKVNRFYHQQSKSIMKYSKKNRLNCSSRNGNIYVINFIYIDMRDNVIFRTFRHNLFLTFTKNLRVTFCHLTSLAKIIKSLTYLISSIIY